MMPLRLLGGQLSFAFPDAAVARFAHIRAGKADPARDQSSTPPQLPKVPTFAEAGDFPGLGNLQLLQGVVAPAGNARGDRAGA